MCPSPTSAAITAPVARRIAGSMRAATATISPVMPSTIERQQRAEREHHRQEDQQASESSTVPNPCSLMKRRILFSLADVVRDLADRVAFEKVDLQVEQPVEDDTPTIAKSTRAVMICSR